MAISSVLRRLSPKKQDKDAVTGPMATEKTSEYSTPAMTPVAHTPTAGTPANGSIHHSTDAEIQHHDNVSVQSEKPKVKVLAVFLGFIASMGGMVFGYESGQISGNIN